MTPPSRTHRRRLRAVRFLALGLLVLPVAVSCAGQAAVAPAAAPAAAGDLRQAPWAHQPDGAPSIHDVAARPSVGFPPGTTYGEALAQLLVAVAETGAPPAGTTVLDPLPAEVVYVTPAGPGDGIRLSLTAPWGWIPATGAIRAPSYSLPGSLSAEEAVRAAAAARDSGAALPEGATVDVPVLPACEIAHGTPADRVPCP
jgi:hypothetical protein